LGRNESKGKWKTVAARLADKGYRVWTALMAGGGGGRGVSPHVSSRLWKAVVRPALTHGAEVVLARLRTGSSELEIERGGWRGLKLDERLCPLCGSGVEDEEHILCRCNRLVGVRRAHTAHLFEKLIDKGYDSTVRELAWGGAEEWLRVRLGCATGLETTPS